MMAAIMALAMSITAFATEGNENTKPSQTSAVYNIYQIFTGEYSQEKATLSNVKWGKNGSGTEGEAISKEELKELEDAYSKTSDVEKLNAIKKFASIVEENAFIRGGIDTEYNVPSGYYLVEGVVTYSNNQQASTLYVVRVVDNQLKFTPKVDVPTVSKNIIEENEERVNNNEASIGDNITYEITGTLPSNYDDYQSYYYVFSDNLSAGLTFNDDIKVEVIDEEGSSVDITNQIYTKGEKQEDGTTIITVGIQDVKKLSDVVVTKDSLIVVTYTAELNEQAVIAGEGNPNTVKLTYSNDPNSEKDGKPNDPENPPSPSENHPVGETPESKVVTYTTELAILKTDGDHKSLSGAGFELTGENVKVSLVTKTEFVEDENGEYWKLADDKGYTKVAPILEDTEDVKSNAADYADTTKKYTLVKRVISKGDQAEQTKVQAMVDDGGLLIFTGLGAGTYTIHEYKTPDGYNTAADIKFTIKYENGKFSSQEVSLGSDNTLWTEIVNKSGSLLPSTGGIGTTIFYVVGAILVIGAGIILVAKKRMSSEA